MSFSGDWLALREAADHRARVDFAAIDLRSFDRIVDLGCGTGSNFRYLAPRLAAQQHWLCIDNDQALLDGLAGRIAAAPPWRVEQRGTTILARGPRAATIETLAHDLARGLPPAAVDARTIVTASALLDLVSAAWLDGLADWCAARRVPALFALTFDGRMSCMPESDFDAELHALVNRHQLGDKGFGPALGPAAAEAAVAAFAARGFACHRARSDWHIGPDESELQRALIGGWCDAARELAVEHSIRIAAWLEQRHREIDSRHLTLMVGHEDQLFLPPQTPQ
jgi:SAM-dependent methyltransferase